MKNTERRQLILELLMQDKKAVSGDELSDRFDVSRQIIVKDIKCLREEGHEILSTHFGYVLRMIPRDRRDFKVKHTTEQTEAELKLIVSLGGTIENVYVWHKVYGKIEAHLGIFSMIQIKDFLEGVRMGKSTELMNITGGYHYHTVKAEDEESLNRIEAALKEHGYLVPEDENKD